VRQVAILYALAHLGPRLRAVRKRTWVLAGLAIVAILAVVAWLAVAIVSWGWSQVPVLPASGRQAATAALQQVEQVAPGLKSGMDQLIDETCPAGKEAAEWPAREVSGTELPGVERFPGFVRTRYGREKHRIELRYLGDGDIRTVLDHYTSQFVRAGFVQEVLNATPEFERHRFGKTGGVVEFEIRQSGKGGKVEVIIVDSIG
jgi:hypothetical protein